MCSPAAMTPCRGELAGRRTTATSTCRLPSLPRRSNCRPSAAVRCAGGRRVKRSDQKEKKYEALTKEMHWKILPLVFTGQCNPATKTIDAFKLIAAARPFAGLKRALLCSSVIACARGNADILGTARARFALVPSHVDSGKPPPHSSLRANTALSHARLSISQPCASASALASASAARFLASSQHEEDDQVLNA
jgi:hypothetical protein